MTTQNSAPRRTPEQTRAALLAAPETLELAKQLGVTAEEYADTVMEYYQDSSKQPELSMLSDADVAALPPGTVPSVGDVQKFLEGVVSGDIVVDPNAPRDTVVKTAQAAAQREARRLTGDHSQVAAPELGSEGSGKVITNDDRHGADLRRQLSQLRAAGSASRSSSSNSTMMPGSGSPVPPAPAPRKSR